MGFIRAATDQRLLEQEITSLLLFQFMFFNFFSFLSYLDYLDFQLLYELATYLQSTAGSFHYGHAEGLSERCVEEDMTLHQNSTNIFVLQSPKQTHSVGRKGMNNAITEIVSLHTTV